MPIVSYLKFSVAILALALFSGGELAAPARAQQAQEPMTVLVQTATNRQIFPEFTHPAIIESEQKATIRPLVTAQVTAIHFTPGEIVEKGALLFELDDRDYQFALAEAEAALALAQAQEGEMKLQFERKETLVSRETAAQSELDLVSAQYDAAKAQTRAAAAAVDRARKSVEDTKIFAPFDGRISAANVSIGDIAAPNNPIQPLPMAEMVALDPIYALGYVSQQAYDLFIQRRDRMQSEGVEIPDLALSLILPSGQIYPETGSFVSWDFQAAANRGSIAARAEFANPGGVLLPGMNVMLRGNLVEAIEAITVPQRAVGQDQQGHYVMVVGGDGTVSRRNIEVGIRDGADWTVPTGLEEGDNVIVEGLQKVREGQTVATQPFQQ